MDELEFKLTESQCNAINECVCAFDKGKGSKVKFLHINGLDYKIYRDEELEEMYDILVSIDKRPLHDELGVHITELFGRICDIAEDKIKYRLA
jgi:hypothetical protein